MNNKAIQKSNENWLKDEKAKCNLVSKEKRRINQILSTKYLRKDEWNGKQYRSVRG